MNDVRRMQAGGRSEYVMEAVVDVVVLSRSVGKETVVKLDEGDPGLARFGCRIASRISMEILR